MGVCVRVQNDVASVSATIAEEVTLMYECQRECHWAVSVIYAGR